MAFGLGEHIQLDLYLNTSHVRDASSSSFTLTGWSAEARWALADWDKIPGNPTCYFEYLIFNQAPDRIEPKILLGGQLAARWHWGVNLTHERELVRIEDRAEEWSGTTAISYTLLDEQVSVGMAGNISSEIERTSGKSETVTALLVGPSLQWRPLVKANLAVEPLFGLTNDSMQLRMFIVFGWEP